MATVTETVKSLMKWLRARGYQEDEKSQAPSLTRVRKGEIGVEALIDRSDYVMISITHSRDWGSLPGLRSWAQCIGLEGKDEEQGWTGWDDVQKVSWAQESVNLCKRVIEILERESRDGLRDLANCAQRRNEEYWRVRDASR